MSEETRCPYCNAPEAHHQKTCRNCGTTYSSADHQELRQLEFLLDEVGVWTERLPTELAGTVAELRRPYVKRISELKTRLIPEPPRAPSSPPPREERMVAPVPKETPRRPRARVERVPFDEWLLSERNIKLALYSGALLLVLAGVIFIGSRWGQLGGPAKFAMILLATGLLYLGGYLLYRRPGLRLGGAAVLGVASGFVPLNFAVLQLHVLGPRGLRSDVMLLIASATCLVPYVLTALWTRSDLFTYLSVGAVAAALTAMLVVVGAPVMAYPLAYLSLALVMLLLAWGMQETPWSSFTRTPLLLSSHLAVPLCFLAVLLGLVFNLDVQLALVGMYLGVCFYIATDTLFGWWAARWAWAALGPLVLGLTLRQIDADDTTLGVALMLLAMVYLALGDSLKRLQGTHKAGLPLYVVAYGLAGWVTFKALPSTPVLILALLGDVVILSLSGVVFRHRAWIYGAVWLFMVPVYLFLAQNVPTPHYRGLLMGLLGLNYLAIGHILSRSEVSAGTLPSRGGPFLTASAFLSIVVVVLTWANPIVATLATISIAVLYLAVALWLDWPVLLFPALMAVHLVVFTTQEILLNHGTVNLRALDAAFAALALVLLACGFWLRQQGYERWATPLYAVCALDVVGTYSAALLLGRPLAVALSAIYATVLLSLAWLERSALRLPDGEIAPVLTYLGLILIVVGYFFLLDAAHLQNHWPQFTAGLCTLFVLLAWVLRRGELGAVYGTPLRHMGLGLTLLPMVGSIVSRHTLLTAITFGIVGWTYAADATLHRVRYLAYAAATAFLVVYWSLLVNLGVNELQAYVIPAGLGLLALGWNERRHSGDLSYHLPTLLGLFCLLALSFIQSVTSDVLAYAVWLTIEGLSVIAWGIWTRSRSYVIAGTSALLLNGLAQLGPALVALPRWIQLAAIGSILLGGGIAFLLRREELLNARRALTEGWTRWQA